ncbi:hypothetical protein C8J55DRAFT_522532 [Lentinula edodes]|uniref:BTB domain-containing protein n=1 Tax=Lentinula lateritia TaxID=40482 RepID=A0A9W8ZYL7_9AGAR|nr:hypothetical protein C8J55DRAFT_522532 [Lentinula edodes]
MVMIHDLFNAPDADVVVRSSDNVEFRLHKKNLECTTGAFPPAGTPVHTDEIVCLTESAAILEILFQFIYPRRIPSLESLDFDSLLPLAEAAEKYEVTGFVYACEAELRKFFRTNPKQILEFSVKHNRTELVEKIMPIMISMDTPLSEVIDILPCNLYKPWSLHRERHLLKPLRKK